MRLAIIGITEHELVMERVAARRCVLARPFRSSENPSRVQLGGLWARVAGHCPRCESNAARRHQRNQMRAVLLTVERYAELQRLAGSAT